MLELLAPQIPGSIPKGRRQGWVDLVPIDCLLTATVRVFYNTQSSTTVRSVNSGAPSKISSMVALAA
jgi:hypothetical protein